MLINSKKLTSSIKLSSTGLPRCSWAILPLVLALASCNNTQVGKQSEAERVNKIAALKPVREPKSQAELEKFTAPNLDLKTQFQSGPGVNITNTVASAESKELSPNLSGQPISANYHDMPLPVFINEVFGTQLGLSFTLDPQIQKQSDLVTMREAVPVPPAVLFRDAVRALSAYGVAVSQQDNVISFSIDKNVTSGETPLLISGRTLPDVPESHRPVFMFVPLKVVANARVAGWVRNAMTGKEITIEEDSSRNAVLLKGKPDLVQQALAIIDVLDQPLMRGKFSTTIEPAFTKVTDLSKNLREVLNAEGYDANIKSSTGSVILIPLDGTNQIVVFAGSQAILEHVREWVKTLDRRQQMSIDQGIFTYEVRNAEASHIVELLNGIENGTATGASTSPSRSLGTAISDTSNASNSASTNTTSISAPIATAKVAGGNFAVDTNRNTIVFKGSGQAWADILPVIQTLDKPAPSVLIEVLLAEVKLDNSESSGIDFISNGTEVKNTIIKTTTISSKSVPTLVASTLDSAGVVRAKLSLYQQKNRVEVRSRPRLMVKSGQTASIDVGNEISVATGAVQNVENNQDSPIRTSFNYRKTGVILKVKPTVHASGNVDIDIDQALSEADTSGGESPSIFNRQVKTMVTLQDGGSVLLAGLISDKKTRGKTGVPWLSSIPLLGKAFRNDTFNTERTELLVMIIPYVVDNPSEAEAITKTIQDAFQRPE